MPRIGRLASNRLSREVLYIRRSVEDAMRWSGTKLVVRRAWTLQDLEEGRVKRCPRCWDPMLEQSRDSRCPFCYGTGMDGGYRPMEVTWGSIMENAPKSEGKREQAGVREYQDMTVKLPCEPIFHNGDVFAEVRRETDGRVTEIGRVFMLDAPVQRQTVQGWVSNVTNDRETRVEDMVVSQSGTLRELLPTDVRCRMGMSFFDGLMPEPSEPETSPVKKGAVDGLLAAEAELFPSGNLKVPDSEIGWLRG